MTKNGLTTPKPGHKKLDGVRDKIVKLIEKEKKGMKLLLYLLLNPL